MATKTCLERLAFTLLTLVLIIVFLIAALVLVYLGTANLNEGGGGGLYPQGSVMRSRTDEDAGMNFEDGVDIVRIKTTEEKVSG